MRNFERRLKKSIAIPAPFRAPSYLVATAATCAMVLAVMPAHPAYAGWGKNLLRAVVPTLARRAEVEARRQQTQGEQLQPGVQYQAQPVMPSQTQSRMMSRAQSQAQAGTQLQTIRTTQAMTYTMPPQAPPVASYRSVSASALPRRTSLLPSSNSGASAPLPGLRRMSATPGNIVYFGSSASASASSAAAATSSLIDSSFAHAAMAASALARTATVPSVAVPGVKKSLPVPLIASAPSDPLSYQWTPRRAIDYLTVDDDIVPFDQVRKSASQKPLPQPRPEPIATTPRAIVPASSAPPSLVSRSFKQGVAGEYTWDDLVAAGVFENDPLHGSVYKRKGAVKYIILHSTETANPADARRVILSWNNRGLRHPGAQFVVDRDGTICSTTDPDMVVIHIEPSRAVAGYSNDNSIGIEIVRSGKQEYTRPQLDSVNRLVAYLQSHYAISDANVTTHHRVQPSDRSDPVNFDMLAFASEKSSLQTAAIAYKANYPNHSARLIQTARAKGDSDRAQSGDLDDALAAADAQSASVKSTVESAQYLSTVPKSAQYLSTMPKSAPDFHRRNKELVLRD